MTSIARGLPRWAIYLGLSLGLLACSTPDVSTYAEQSPKLDLRRYFDGPVRAYGMFQDRSGEIVRRFEVDITSTWAGNQGTLDERFVYADGSTQRRVWRLTLGPDGAVQGTADDVIGTAQGRIAGNTMNWRYTLSLPVDDEVYEVQFDDWLVLMNERVMLNRATMSKFGISLGEVTLTFVKP